MAFTTLLSASKQIKNLARGEDGAGADAENAGVLKVKRTSTYFRSYLSAIPKLLQYVAGVGAIIRQ